MFEVIGARINTSSKMIRAAVAERDADYIIDDVQKQLKAGANYSDVNACARIGHINVKHICLYLLERPD
jgi:cobalamin-dependent methionine synthase I